ncbi:succinate dehydrogenase assembly factor 2 [Proteobacteria bacterium 005FR1]|nr:succinate dehydrogenase assembly factor 2 [Proteobacteria bacterium 005FR1]
MSELDQLQKNKLFWASRRGMLELDLVLLPFVENVFAGLPEEDKDRYWKLLDQEDQDLFAWLLRRGEPEDEDLRRIVEIVRANTGMRASGD